MPFMDLAFPIVGTSLPLDHGYALYAAISRLLGADSHGRNSIGIFPVAGIRAEPGQLKLDETSRLRIRTPGERLPLLLKLSGKPLDVDGHRLRIGTPQVYALTPAASLVARLVTIKGFRDPEPFLAAASRKLQEGGIAGKPAIPLRRSGPRQGEPIRRVLRIKDKRVVGFSLVVTELTPEESITLQETGLGGRRHMGCGLFVPWRPRA